MSRFERVRVRRRRRIIRLVLAILIVGSAVYFVVNMNGKPKPQPNVQKVQALITSIPTPQMTPANSPLKNAVQSELVGTKGSYAVVVKNLKTQETYLFNEQKVYDAGSLYKLWIMAETYRQIKTDKLNEEDMLKQKIEALNEKFKISSESAEKKDGEIELSVNDATTRMITISDNYAALLLAEKIRLSNVITYLKVHDLVDSNLGADGKPPSATANDIANFFEKLYKGELADQEYTEKMLVLLKSQRINHKIPKYLPPEAVIAHKTGELDGFSHDAGIVYTPKSDYIIVVLSKSTDRAAANERIASVSKAVYNYFLNIE